MKNAGFDYVIIETVGVGQSEVDIASLADITIVVLVPEGGDVIQTMKAGLMEVADIFVINKYDRPEADKFYNALKQMSGHLIKPASAQVPVFKTVASEKKGIAELYKKISEGVFGKHSEQRTDLILEKTWSLIRDRKMKVIDKDKMKVKLSKALTDPEFNMYFFAKKYFDEPGE
jgi:LAO/AO transport system kinase